MPNTARRLLPILLLAASVPADVPASSHPGGVLLVVLLLAAGAILVRARSSRHPGCTSFFPRAGPHLL